MFLSKTIMKKISVIIPVYNVKDYLCDTVQSVINQSYKNIEIILVDDGSTDGSSLLCDRFCKMNENVVVIHQNNTGLSGARNSGLKKCTGDYISFIDSDDLISNNFYESLINAVNNRERYIGLCRVERFDDGNFLEKKYKKETICLNKQDTYDEIIDSLLGKKSHFCNVSACQFLFPKSVIYGIEFPVGRVNEDWFFTYKVIDKANNVIYCNDAIYYYRTRKSSLSTSKIARTDMLDGINLMIRFLNEKNFTTQRNKLSNIFVKRADKVFFNLCKSGYDSGKRNIISNGIKTNIVYAPCRYVSVVYYVIAIGIIISPSFMEKLAKILLGITRND